MIRTREKETRTLRQIQLILPPDAYSGADLERIANAINVTRDAVEQYVDALDRARVFVKYHGKAMPKSPTRHREEMLRIAASARRLRESLIPLSPAAAEKSISNLLRHLGVNDWIEAADGPAQDIVDSLDYARGTSRNALVGLTRILGDLPLILVAVRSQAQSHPKIDVPAEMMAAVDELERVASDAADQILHLGKIVVPKGHHGDLEVTGWIEDMARVYHAITGRHPTAWVNTNAQASAFIRLLQAAGPPIGLNYGPAAWRRRVRGYLREFPRPQK